MTTTTNRCKRWLAIEHAFDEGRIAALAGEPIESCPLTEPDERDAFCRGHRHQVSLLALHAGRLSEGETELDQSTPQPWRYDLMFWLAAVAVVAFFVTVVWLATKGGG